MKKIIASIACIVALFTLFGCNADNGNSNESSSNDSSLIVDNSHDTTKPPVNDTTQNTTQNTSPNVNGEVKELLSVDELVEFHLHGNKYPENFVFDELGGYGRVIKSSSSEDEVLAVVEKHFTNDVCTVVENELCVETPLFYGVYVKWAFQREEMTAPTYYDEYVVSFKADAYDTENNQFGIKNKDEIKNILDYIYYSKTYQIGGYKVYSSDIHYEDGKYNYVTYLLEVCYGDWDVQDGLTFVKEVWQIDEATGNVTSSRESLGTVYIDGDGMNYKVN